MATQYDQIDDKQRAFIERQHVFFVASAAPGARVNVSPKGSTRCVFSAPTRSFISISPAAVTRLRRTCWPTAA